MVHVQNATITSYLDWWRTTGAVDPVSDDRTNWLARPVALAAAFDPVPQGVVLTAQTPMTAPRDSKHQPAATPAMTRETTVAAADFTLPDTLEAFERWLAEADDLPGARWSRRRLLPTGPVAAPLMLIGDMPDDDDIMAGTLFAGAVGALLDAMLAAIGYQRDALRLATIALTRPPGGKIDATSADRLATIMRHHIDLARPRHIIILGQDSCRILTGTEIIPDGDALRSINHYGATTAALAIHHPRLLIQRPMLKRMTWNALKTLKEPD